MAHYRQRGERSFLLTVELGYDSKGKRIKRTKTIKVEDDALLKTTRKLDNYLQKQLAQFEIEVEAGEYISPDKTLFQDFVNEWHDRYAIKKLSPTVVAAYNSSLKHHILPGFGEKRIGDIKTIQLIRFLDDKATGTNERKDGRNGPLSDQTIRKFYDALSNVFARAKEWNLIQQNPMDGVKKPSIDKKEMSFYSSEDLSDVLEALNKEPLMWRVYFLGALIGGLRRGELTALEWEHIDFESNEIDIQNNIVGTKESKAVVKDPKTKSSKARVVMPGWYMQLLQDYETEWKIEKMKAGELWEGGDHEYLFHAGTGKALYYTTPTTKWKRIIKKHELKPIRLHDLRHTMVALLYEEDDVNLPAISRRARHASSKITDEIYGHISKKRAKQTANQFDKYAPPQKNGRQMGDKSIF